MKLNLGCGDDIRDGYTNVDFRKTHPSVYECDLSKFPWPWGTGEVDEILMLDFLEHFPYASTPFILLECHRILRHSGEVVIQVPDAGHLAMALTHKGPFLCNRCGTEMYDRETSREVGSFVAHEECPKCRQSREDIADAAMRRLYGGQDYTGNFHHRCFTEEMLLHEAWMAGLRLVTFEEREHQFANWNFKARFAKGDLW